MRLTKDTDKKDTGGMRKKWGTGEKECRNLLDKECEQVENDSQTGERDWANLPKKQGNEMQYIYISLPCLFFKIRKKGFTA